MIVFFETKICTQKLNTKINKQIVLKDVYLFPFSIDIQLLRSLFIVFLNQKN